MIAPPHISALPEAVVWALAVAPDALSMLTAIRTRNVMGRTIVCHVSVHPTWTARTASVVRKKLRDASGFPAYPTHSAMEIFV